MSKLADLIGTASSPISRAPQRLREAPVTLKRDLRVELEALLHLRDGFTALGGALIVRPTVTVSAVRGVDDWNQLSLWRTPYGKCSEILFFAEDRFGQQFGLLRDEVVRFDAYDGSYQHVGFSLDRWAEYLLEDSERVGTTELSLYVLEHGTLSAGERLQPRVPPPFQAPHDPPPTLCKVDDLTLMRKQARLYKETRDAPGVPPAGYEEWWWEE